MLAEQEWKMTKEEFIKEAHRLSLEFAQLCWVFNRSESKDCSAEVYGSKTEASKGTIIVANITFSMQQMGSSMLTNSVKPATLEFDIGSYNTAKRINGKSYFDWRSAHNFSNLAEFATELNVTEFAYGKEVKA